MADGVQRNADGQRFELPLDGGKSAFISYTEGDNGALNFTHTEVPQGFEGQGIGAKLVRGALEMVKADGGKVIPSCPYVGKFIEKNEEFKSLLANA